MGVHKDVTISEVQSAKDDCERNIKGALNHFMKVTGLRVDDVGFVLDADITGAVIVTHTSITVRV